MSAGEARAVSRPPRPSSPLLISPYEQGEPPASRAEASDLIDTLKAELDKLGKAGDEQRPVSEGQLRYLEVGAGLGAVSQPVCSLRGR